MEQDLIMRLGQQTLQTAALLASPLLVSALVIGLCVSIFQAVTQINEATLTFIPKMGVVVLVLLIAGPWMLDVMMTFTINLFENISMYIRE